MRLFIVEKPSVAKAIAVELGITGKNDCFIRYGGNANRSHRIRTHKEGRSIA